ncbi:hypothetical protein E3N88_15768 [Mikania micrantha]|uniref:CCHC-type domain-containing protein n=1 Tax=Mikania micrantha TaxID=192012 RepID=A0A5N6NXR5_9ASTR|nr:hypothetical protein E3N88_15768 [Mikania micrantha]
MEMNNNETIDEFAGRLNSIASMAKNLSDVFDDATLVQKLKIYEERIRPKEDKQNDESNKSLFTHHKGRFGRGNNFRHNNNNGRFQQGYRQNRGRNDYQQREEGHISYKSGRTDNKPQRKDGEHSTSDTNEKTQITCYRCQKLGHYDYDCPNKNHKNVESLFVETQEEEIALLMCQVAEGKKEN